MVEAKALKDYLISNGYPMTVMLAEDGTRLVQQAQYDSRSNTITGCVPPLDGNGLPVQGYFDATNAYRVAQHLTTCSIANTAYVQVAIPLAPKAAPFVLFYMPTDNTFTYADVIRRWKHTIALLRTYGIEVLGIGSDGDPTLLKAMVMLTKYSKQPFSELSDYFFIEAIKQALIYFQDTLHELNKMRRRLFTGSMLLGTHHIGIDHLEFLVNNYSMDKHGLTMADLHPKDLMSFRPTEKIIKKQLIDFMEQNVPGSAGTVALLRMMHNIYRAFVEDDVAPLERIALCW